MYILESNFVYNYQFYLERLVVEDVSYDDICWVLLNGTITFVLHLCVRTCIEITILYFDWKWYEYPISVCG